MISKIHKSGIKELENRYKMPFSQQFTLITTNARGKVITLKGSTNNGEIYLKICGKWRLAWLGEDTKDGLVCDTTEKYVFYPIYLLFFNEKGGSNRLNFMKYKTPMKLNPFKYTSYPSNYFKRGYDLEVELMNKNAVKKAMELEKKFEKYFIQNLPEGYNVFRTPFSGMNNRFKDMVITNEKDYILYLIDVERIHTVNNNKYIQKGVGYLDVQFIFPYLFVYTPNNDPFNEEPRFLKPVKDLWRKGENDFYKSVIPLKRCEEMSLKFDEFIAL